MDAQSYPRDISHRFSIAENGRAICVRCASPLLAVIQRPRMDVDLDFELVCPNPSPARSHLQLPLRPVVDYIGDRVVEEINSSEFVRACATRPP
jgi:hypothetical protein